MDLAYFGPCFEGSTVVITSDGVKEIKDVSIGDIVLTHLGNWKKVTEKFKTEYGLEIHNVGLSLQNNIFLQCTENHDFFSHNELWKSAGSLSGNELLRVPEIRFCKDEKYASPNVRRTCRYW